MTEQTATRAEADCKRLSTLTARAALVGVVVDRVESDFGGEEFIASRWALTKSFSCLDALEEWLDELDRGRSLEASA